MRSRRPGRSERPGVETGRAKAVILGGLVLALFAVMLNVVPLRVCAASFVVLGLIAIVWARSGIRGLAVTRRLLERRVIEGDLLEAVIEVSGRHARFAGVAVDDELSGRVVPISGPRWRRTDHRSVQLRVVAPAGRRGRHAFAAPSLIVEDPLGLARARVPGAGSSDEVLVLPRTERVHWMAGARRQASGEETVGRAVTGAGEIDGLRDYRPGAPAARIYWPGLARGVGLLERRIVSASDARPLLVLDNRCAALPAGLDHLDAAIRALASLALELAQHGGCSVLLPGARTPLVVGADLRGWPGLHTRLSLIEPERLLWHAPRINLGNIQGPLLYVAASGTEPPPLTRAGAYAVMLVVPLACGAERTGQVFEVAGCAGYRLRSRVGGFGSTRGAAA
jgi:uncharacterized protein (DUF58 family)